MYHSRKLNMLNRPISGCVRYSKQVLGYGFLPSLLRFERRMAVQWRTWGSAACTSSQRVMLWMASVRAGESPWSLFSTSTRSKDYKRNTHIMRISSTWESVLAKCHVLLLLSNESPSDIQQVFWFCSSNILNLHPVKYVYWAEQGLSTWVKSLLCSFMTSELKNMILNG